MRDYASTRTHIHLSDGDKPKVEIVVNGTQGSRPYLVLNIDAIGSYASYFIYPAEGQTIGDLLNSVLRTFSSPVVIHQD